jgi:hypothetical protein
VNSLLVGALSFLESHHGGERSRRERRERKNRISRVRRYPLIVFFVLAYVFSWWPWPLYALGLAPSPITGFGPFFAAVVVLALTVGKAGVVALLRRLVRWRVAPV